MSPEWFCGALCQIANACMCNLEICSRIHLWIMKEMPLPSHNMWIDPKSDVDIETIATDEHCLWDIQLCCHSASFTDTNWWSPRHLICLDAFLTYTESHQLRTPYNIPFGRYLAATATFRSMKWTKIFSFKSKIRPLFYFKYAVDDPLRHISFKTWSRPSQKSDRITNGRPESLISSQIHHVHSNYNISILSPAKRLILLERGKPLRVKMDYEISWERLDKFHFLSEAQN
jgi:hypothetical protein